MADHPCPGGCNSRYREARAAWQHAVDRYDPLDSAQERPGPPEIIPWPGEPVWCAGCAAVIGRRLAQFDTLAAILSAAADGHRPSAALERVSGSPEPPSPSRAADDLDEMFTMLSTWEDAYRDLKGWSSGPARGDLASRETECVEWLQRHLRGILCSGIAADFGAEVLQWHAESARAAKAGARTLRKPVRCSRCHLMLLDWKEGEDRVACANPDCRLVMSYGQYEAEVARLTAEGRLITEAPAA